jgi:hypothetical protein
MRDLARTLGTALLMAGGLFSAARATTPEVPHYDHIFLVMEENHGFADIIGNPAAPNLNALAKAYGVATRYYSVADPSAPNYVALLGGDFFGIADDNAYYTHEIDQKSLTVQLEEAGLSWKGYYQSMPFPGYRGICFPGRCNGTPDFDPLYSAKHNGVVYFKPFEDNPASRLRMVPFQQLATDLAGDPPNFGYIIPNQCYDMHGSPPWCGDSGNLFDPHDNQLVGRGDAWVQQQVDLITAAPFWSKGRNAIVITFDEGDDNATCCGVPGTGQVLTIVITNHGPRGLQDPTPYNHYSLLLTFQQAFGLGCLQHTCDAANTVPMAPLFAVK